jgi:hypothetical protein
MNKVEVFDPPMCCSTGVCDPTVDPALVRFCGGSSLAGEPAGRLKRYNLAQQPQAFAASAVVKSALKEYGNECLLLILLDGVI